MSQTNSDSSTANGFRSIIKSARRKIAGIAHDSSAEEVAEEKFRLAVEASPDGMLMADASNSIVMVNTEIERMFGYGRHELIGQHVGILLPPRLHAKYFRERADYVRHQKKARFGANRDLFGLRRDGSEFPIEVGLNPIRVPEGLLVLSVIVDISERQRIDQLKDEFVSTVSHELRTPLTSIAGSLGLLIGGAAGKLPEPALRLLAIAHNNSQRLVRLVNDILDMEKLESGQAVFNFKRIDARALVDQVVDANRGYADGYQVRVRLDPASTVATAYADPDRLAQVVTNLLSNAIKFTPAGKEVTVAIEESAGIVRIAVRDQGPGIPAQFKTRIFEKFAQADATDARQKSGTGLGLSIVKQIVARLGGKVGFEDGDGGGTVFYVELPAWSKVAARETDTESFAQAGRILLCGDDPDRTVALRDGLHPLGFSVDFAHNAADVVPRALANGYGAIVVDLELPDGGGINLVRRLRERPEIYKTPIVVMSYGRPTDQDAAAAANLNVFEWTEKPVPSDRLAQILDRAVDRRTSGRPLILHVDSDPDVLNLVAVALGSTAIVVSVESIDEARRALLTHQIDLVILDISGVDGASGINLLPELRSRNGKPIPVIFFSGHAADLAASAQVDVDLNKSHVSLDGLLTAIHDRLMLQSREGMEAP